MSDPKIALPDFSKYPNVDPEKVVKTMTLFKAEEGKSLDMDSFDKAWEEEQKITEGSIWVNLYMYVGLYCGWSWKEFRETPYEVIKTIKLKIDKKLEDLDNNQKWFSWEMLSVALAIARCFSSGNSE